PTTGLDPRARRDVWNAIAGLKKQGKTVFLTTHYMEEAEYLADSIAIMHRGRIVAEGTLDELIQKYGKRSTLLLKGGRAEEAAEALKENGYDAEVVDGDVEIKIVKRDAVLDILFYLREKGISYREVDIRHSDLEDVFLNLTGEKLAEET
ncbi:MAG: ABC transporter ATP-binding protein, partial [Thermoplasmata archaeon]